MFSRLTPAGIALIYAVVAVLWHVASDYLLEFVAGDTILWERTEFISDSVFFVVTSGLLYLLLKEWRESADGASTMRVDAISPPRATRLVVLFVALALVVPLIGFSIARLQGPELAREALADLDVIVQLKAEQIENWLDERRGDSEVLAGDDAFAARVSRFAQHRRDATLSKPVLERFGQLISNYHYTRILLLDTGGRLMLTSGEEIGMAPVLPDLWRKALDSKQVQQRDIYRDEEGHIHLEWAVPIVVPNARGVRAVAVVVLRVTAQSFIFPLIQSWPTASPSGETMLMRRDGESVLFLNQLRHLDFAPMTFRPPLSTPDLPAATAIRDNRPGTVAGIDYRGVPVLAAYRPVAGTDWHLVAKLDHDEVLAPLRVLVFWVSLVAFFAIAAVSMVLLQLWRQQRRAHSLALLAEKAKADRLLRQFFDLPFIGMAMSSPETKLWTQFNDRLCAIFGYSREELAEKTWAEMIHPEDIEANVTEYERIMRGESDGYTRDIRFMRKDGAVVFTTVDVKCVRKPDGAVDYFIATIQDITRRKRAEEAVLQLNAELENKVAARTADLEQARHEADQANQTKSAFLAAMSHEIRTPMNGVIGMVDVLHQTSLKGYQVEMVDLIRESAYSLLGIINDILDFSKIEANQMEVESAPMRVSDEVEKVCSMLNRMALKKGVELTLFTSPDIPEEVMGDPLRLRQVLINLINNALKFSGGREQQGLVSVRAALAGRSPERVVVEIRIADNGIGMDQKTLSGLFKPFTQADASTTRRFGGTGLGLTISRHLVELMGGEITVQSEAGKGSTFTVRLPFVPLPEKPDEAASPVAGLSCLVVDGADGLTGDMATYLTHGGAVVERVPDLAAALEWFGSKPPGLWITVIDAKADAAPPEELRNFFRGRPEQQGARFIVIGRGQRRSPRLEGVDWVSVDGNALNRRTFFRTVAIAAGRAQEDTRPQQHGRSEAEFCMPSREDAQRLGRLILVAEDNETNQKVILRQLALLGFAADVVGDGRKALQNWQRGDYGLLLSDLHMPEMDGYELTAAIRAAEQGLRHIPIVALTANALKGEAEHCRAAGMDGYLSKPVPLEELKAMLKQWLPSPAESTPGSPAPAALRPATSQPVNVSVLKTLVGDDPALVSEFLHDFRASAVKTAAELKAASAGGQTAQAGALAHKLKSSARSVGALTLGDLCAELEQSAKTGQAEALAALLPRFEAEMAAVTEYLDSL